MRTVTFLLSLILNFMIPWEGVVRIGGVGTGVKIFGYILAAFWLATIVITRRVRKPGTFQVLLCLLVLWYALSVFWSENPSRSAAHAVTWFQMLLLAYIWWDLYTTRTAVLAGLQSYVLGAYVSLGSAIGNFMSGKVFYSHYDRYSAGETNPDGFGFLLAVGIPIAWYLAISENTAGKARWLRFVNYAYIPLAFMGIALSGTRTALIASVVGTAFGLASLTRVRIWVRIVILLLLIAASFYLLPYVQNLRSFERLGTTGTELTQGDLNNRTNNWQEGFAAFREQPILGIGGNMYPTVNRWGKAAHNSFMAVLVELGLVGFLIFGGILLIVFTEAWRQPKWESRFWLTVFGVWILGSYTLTWTHRKPTWLLLSLLIAAASLTVRREEAVYHEEAVPLPHHRDPEILAVPHLRPSK
ncbi:MAG TPA: O-antigen ligase family protein [Anaerolineales bacterium]|nr:O-antigen ligase family protein [Anaerolineales bacterium]